MLYSLADKTLRSDGTPFYIVSVLIDYRDARIRMHDIEKFPSKVVDVWKDKISSLSTTEKTLLDCLKLLKMIYTPKYTVIVNEMYENLFGESKADLFGAIESLEWKLWLKEEEYTYSSFDVQLEAIEIRNVMFNAFKQFVDRNELEQIYKSHLFFGMSYYYSENIRESKTKAELSSNLKKAIGYIEEAIGIYGELGLKADLADSLAISVIVYNEYIDFDANYFMKAAENCDEAIKIFLDFGMVYKAKPLIPYGIHFHETLFEIDSEERHKQVIELYKEIVRDS
jgi:hypothetical protein